MNQTQTDILNRLISSSKSRASHTEGDEVIIFKTARTSMLEDVLKNLGFKQNIKQDKFGSYFGHCSWWHEDAQILVSNPSGSVNWTIGTVDGPLTGVEMAGSEAA